MSMMPTSFFKIGRDELPDDVSPKYKIGELVKVFYMIEYKIKWMEKDEFGFVLEHSIEPMEIK